MPRLRANGDARKLPAAVAIPVCRTELTAGELLSLRRCDEVLSSHPLILVAPESMGVGRYLDIAPRLIVKRFPDRYFRDYPGANQLKMTARFFLAFKEYDYVLVHELDALVFRDELLQWCREGYDYVGAPWVDAPWLESMVRTATLARRFAPWWRRRINNIAGNGGFSLRKVRSSVISALVWGYKGRKWHVVHEDVFWSLYVPCYNPWFRVPPLETALRFSWDIHPERCWELTGGILPFGCHAWEKHGIEFWRPHFEGHGIRATSSGVPEYYQRNTVKQHSSWKATMP